MIKAIKPIKIGKPVIKPAFTKEDKTPWHDIFKEYGFNESSIPKSPPPPQGSEYGPILTWVTSDGFEPFDNETSLAIDIWTGKVDIWNIEPEVPQEETPTASFFNKF